MTNTRVIEHLRRAEIFGGLDDQELIQIAGVCKAVKAHTDTTIFHEGDEGHEFYIIHEGSVRVQITTRRADGSVSPSTINMLYAGQCFGELVLLNNAHRSATITASEPTTLIVLGDQDFSRLCESSPRIGYLVMRNLAQDLAFKLRSSNLLLRGNIRWQRGELGGHA
ncbi:cyclic nucleotide-binding domain-containing protein [Chloroflexia bacterium SDU3-3]|nr:cyclic nucleotide-binding domain-containing protein [Chloroflexia bacterium SDU3-3]